MTYCKHCGFEIIKGSSFCKECGNQVKKQKKNKKLPKILIAVGIILGVVWLYYPSNNCNLPIKYGVGQVDSRFNLSKREIKNLTIDAGNRWNQSAGKTLFQYDENAPLKINLVYDDRQANIDKLKSELNSLDLTDFTISSANDRLEQMINDYQSDLDSYNSDVDFYNIWGDSWYEENSLNSRKDDLNRRRRELIRAAELLDMQIDSRNNNLATIQQEIDSKKDQQEIQGFYYIQNKNIDVFMFGGEDDLRLVLMHEIGHAIGAEHTTNPSTIMYYLLDQQNQSDPKPQKEDIDSVKNKCHI